ncbi:ATP:ADP antiporter, AAA family [Flavobacteriaceae bacterium MAR_2010_188]|nr:ATP:ADP antiporter, AAA family [Flavobacteriaceae bacterium MAR_2010_188]
MFKKFFKETFDIRDNEIKIALLMQLYIFMIITVLLIVKPSVNALFLSYLGADSLPYAYIIVAFTAIISSYFYNGALRKFLLRNVTIFSLIIFGLTFVTLGICLRYDYFNQFLLYFFYVSVSIFAVLTTSQFWILANIVFNAREAKRLFGFIGAGAIAGGIFGGYLTTIIVSTFNNMTVIMIAAFLLMLCIPLLIIIWRLRIRKLTMYERRKRKHNEGVEVSQSAFRLIINSKHLYITAGIISVGVFIARLVDFQFSDFANRAITNPEDLTSFFGFWFSTFNVVALLVQLLLTNRLLSYFGVTSTLLILPLSLALGCLLFLTFPELWVLIIIKGIDGSFKQSINKAALELSILPIPYYIKNQAKSYIDVVVDSVATGVAGLMLIFLIKRLDLNTSYITVIIILFLFVWLLFIYKLRGAYFDSFRKNLQLSLETDKASKRNLLKENTVTSAIRVLQTGSDEEIINLLDRLSNYKLKSLKESVLSLLDHPSDEVKLAVIEQLYNYEKGTGYNKIIDLIHTENDELVYSAMDYLISHTNVKDDEVFKSYLDHESSYISTAALLCLSRESNNNSRLAEAYDLEDRISTKIRHLHKPENITRKQEIAELLITIGYSNLTKYYSFISLHFNNRDPYVVKHAIKAAGLTTDERFIDPILNFLSEDDYRKNAIKALKMFGSSITVNILKRLQSETFSDNIEKHVPKVLESFNTRQSIRVLLRLLRSKDVVIRMESSKSLSALKTKDSTLIINQGKLTKLILRETKYYKFTLDAIATIQHTINNEMLIEGNEDDTTERLIARENLIDTLNEQLDLSLFCLFNLLGLKYEKTDVDVAYYGLKSDLKEAKVNAVEFLDNLLQIKLKSTVLPLIEYHVIDSDEKGLSSFQPTISNEKTVLLKLMRDRGKRIKLDVLNIIKNLDDPTYIPQISYLKKHRNQDVQFFLTKTLISLNTAR